MSYRILAGMLCFCLILAGLTTGCGYKPSQVAPADLPVVPVSKPVDREVTDYVDFTGRTDAVQAVDVRPRVTGYLVQMPFKEGADVKAGDLLFEIDRRPYQAQHDQAQSQVTLNDASLRLAKSTYERDRAVANSVPGGVSQQQLDQDRAAVEEAEARLKAYQASTEVYKLNLSFTKVVSPIDGQVSRYYLTLGNLVNQDQTLLTTVVSLDPMYVYFDVDEPTLLRIRRAVNEGKIKRHEDAKAPVPSTIVSAVGQAGGLPNPWPIGWVAEAVLKIPISVVMGLQGEDGYPHQGMIDFFNNQVNPTTGSISARAVFDNPRPDGGVRLLSPGMFVRIRLPIGQPHPARLVIDRAIGSDQGLKYVYVLDEENKVQYRRIETGPLQADGLRVVEGLKGDEWVVVGALQQVRPRMEVRPEKIPMPSLTSQPGRARLPAEANKPAPLGASRQEPRPAAQPGSPKQGGDRP